MLNVSLQMIPQYYHLHTAEETSRCIKVKFANVLLLALFQIIPFSILCSKMQVVQ